MKILNWKKQNPLVYMVYTKICQRCKVWMSIAPPEQTEQQRIHNKIDFAPQASIVMNLNFLARIEIPYSENLRPCLTCVHARLLRPLGYERMHLPLVKWQMHHLISNISECSTPNVTNLFIFYKKPGFLLQEFGYLSLHICCVYINSFLS